MCTVPARAARAFEARLQPCKGISSRAPPRGRLNNNSLVPPVIGQRRRSPKPFAVVDRRLWHSDRRNMSSANRRSDRRYRHIGRGRATDRPPVSHRPAVSRGGSRSMRVARVRAAPVRGRPRCRVAGRCGSRGALRWSAVGAVAFGSEEICLLPIAGQTDDVDVFGTWRGRQVDQRVSHRSCRYSRGLGRCEFATAHMSLLPARDRARPSTAMPGSQARGPKRFHASTEAVGIIRKNSQSTQRK